MTEQRSEAQIAACWAQLREAERLMAIGDQASERAAIAAFETAVVECATDPAVVLAGGLALAQILGSRALDVETEKLQVALQHAERARDAALELAGPEPGCSAAFAAVGTLQIRLADRLPKEAYEATTAAALANLREARRRTTPDDPNKIKRLANLAACLQRATPDPKARKQQLDEATTIYDSLLLLDLGENEGAVLVQAAHCAQLSAAAARKRHDSHGADAAVARAESLYARAIERAGADDAAGGAMMGLARLRFENIGDSNSSERTDDVITLAADALRRLVSDTGFRREAQMQLAEMHLARYRERRVPSDAAKANELSHEALNSWHHERPSIEFDRACERRVDILCSVTLSDVGTDEHLIELDELLQTEYAESERTAQMDAVHEMAEVVRILHSAQVADEAHLALIGCADRFENTLLASDFVDSDPVWWARWFGVHCRIATWAEWAGVDRQEWVAKFVEAATRMAERVRSFHAPSEAFALAHVQLAEAAKTHAVYQSGEAGLRASLAHLDAALTGNAWLPLAHRIKLGMDGAYLSELLGADAQPWIAHAVMAAAELENAPGAPLSARLATSRYRYELAGAAAVLETDPGELAWRQHSVALPHVADVGEGAFRRDIEDLSKQATPVFLAQSRRSCKAAIVRDGVWSVVDLPELALDHIGAVIVAAHHAQAAAGSGVLNARATWTSARRQLHASLSNALLPLVTALANEHRPIVLSPSGWTHAVPVAPVLMALLDHAVPVVVALGQRQDSQDSLPTRDRKVSALAAPGDGSRYRTLSLALDDAEYVAGLFGATAVHDATRSAAVAALSESSTVLLACHGASSDRAEQSRLILCDGELTASDIVDLDLAGLEFVLAAACESLATDQRTPEHPFNVQSALVLAGAAMACGPQWSIDDRVASTFTRALFDAFVAGVSRAQAYRTASAAVVAAAPDFRDMTLLVANGWEVLR